ncbi:MAG TPA: hypothetical protein VMB47_05440 [Candidatus Aquilonibacter sp.]|nr:hypothetical protein [Candidatus Aquilonibacter sp.]
MPPEYYLGAGVVLIVLVLLPFVFVRRRPVRRAAPQPGGSGITSPDELTRQLARVADGLEALLKQLQSMQFSPAPPSRAERAAHAALPVSQAVPIVALQRAQPEPARAPLPQVPLPPDRVQEPSAEMPVIEQTAVSVTASAVAETAAAEPVAVEQSAAEQPVKRRVKLSMFGR